VVSRTSCRSSAIGDWSVMRGYQAIGVRASLHISSFMLGAFPRKQGALRARASMMSPH
jgi:hypothetical protein